MRYLKSIPRTPIDSETVRSMGYDEGDWVLQVEFSNGMICNYFRVPPHEYQALKSAQSIDKQLRRDINRYYESKRIEAAEESVA